MAGTRKEKKDSEQGRPTEKEQNEKGKESKFLIRK